MTKVNYSGLPGIAKLNQIRLISHLGSVQVSIINTEQLISYKPKQIILL